MDMLNVQVDAPVAAFGVADDARVFDSRWHAHEKHQLLYAAKGTLQLDVAGAQWLLPPQRAAWMSGRVQHRARAMHSVALRMVYLPPREAPSAQANTSQCSR
jgi:quercetin dioxygenase-like cupin family protein